MKKLGFFFLFIQTLTAFEFTQTRIPLSTLGDVVYDIYHIQDTKCEASLSFVFDDKDLTGDYLIKIAPLTESRFSLMNQANEIIFSFEQSLEKGEFIYQENTSSSLKVSYSYNGRKNQEVVLTFPIVLQKEQFALPGNYMLDLQVIALRNDEIVAKKILSMNVIVQQQCQVMISDTKNEVFQDTKFVAWDFGPIENEITKQAALCVRANYDFSIEIESKNKGRLLLTERNSPLCEIPFHLFLEKTRLNLESGSCRVPSLQNFTLQKSLALTLFPDSEKNLAGNYQDLILLSIISKN